MAAATSDTLVARPKPEQPQTARLSEWPPRVAVVIATYNRPEVLLFAIRSALAQTYRNLEVVVVGDACGAATGEFVASIDDPRVRYIELPRNYGEQSGPNNVGVAASESDYIAFLNHDDMWFADHLEIAIAWLEATMADLVFARAARVMPPVDGANANSTPDKWYTLIDGDSTRGRYDPAVTGAPASTWVLRRRLHQQLRGWRPAIECRRESSRDFLLRAWRSGASLHAVPHLTCVLVQSGYRPNCYDPDTATERSCENQHLWSQMTSNPRFPVELLERVARPTVDGGSPLRRFLRPVRTALRRSWQRWIASIGGTPGVVYRNGRHWGLLAPGEIIRKLRNIRGLPKMRSPDPTIDALLAEELRRVDEAKK